MKLKAVPGIMLTLLLTCMLTLTFNIQGAESSEPPATEWTRTYGGTGYERAHSVVKTTDGGYAIAGLTDSFGAGNGDFWLVKVDSSGNVQWNKTYGGANYDEAHCVVQTADGGYALTGYTDSFGAGGDDFWLVKVDLYGNMRWARTYGGANNERAHSVVKTAEGGYAIAGSTESFGAGNADFWLVKVDSSGNVQWNKTYGGANYERARSMVKTAEGGYALAGYTSSFGVGLYDFWLVKVNSAGNVQWNKTYGGAATDYVHSIIQTSDGGYALAGYTDSFGAGGFDFWLVKVDSSGNMQWNKTYGGANWDEARSIQQTVDRGYALAGLTNSSGAGGFDFWLVKVDSSGNVEWNKTYGGASDDRAYSVVETADGEYALAGWTNSFGAGYFDFWLVKVGGGPTPNEGGKTPEDKSGLSVLYIVLASAIILVIVATTVFVKLKKKKQ